MACQSALSGKRGSSYVIDHSEQTWTCQRCYSRLLCPDHSVWVFFFFKSCSLTMLFHNRQVETRIGVDLPVVRHHQQNLRKISETIPTMLATAQRRLHFFDRYHYCRVRYDIHQSVAITSTYIFPFIECFVHHQDVYTQQHSFHFITISRDTKLSTVPSAI